MDFQTHAFKLPVNNFDCIADAEKKKKRHGELLPDSIRAACVGPSNCGKTNSLLSLITHPNGLRFENVYVYSKSLNQPKYMFLEKLIKSTKCVKYFAFSDHEAVITPDNILPNSLMIFDDVACENQNSIKSYFCLGRHKNCDSFYLCQSYTRIPKHLVRDNVNFLIIFRQDDLNLKHIYDDHVNTDMDFVQFKKLCGTCWNESKHSFIVIDKDSEINDGRYRKGFDCFAINITKDP